MQLQLPFHLENFIGGNFIGPLSGRFIDNINPATGEVYGQIPDSNEKDINVAVMAAEKAKSGWAATPAEKKFLVLNKIADLIDANAEELALVETIVVALKAMVHWFVGAITGMANQRRLPERLSH